MLRRSGAMAAALIALAALACEHRELPMSPSALSEGIVLYEHASFHGNTAHITTDIADLRQFTGPCVHSDGETTSRDWNDCVSAVRVAPGWRVTLYEHPGYRGDWLDLTDDHSNLQLARGDCSHGGLNDCVSSVRLRRP